MIPTNALSYNGLSCVECHESQYMTPSGPTCKNDHGGVDGYPTPTAKRMPAQKPGRSKQDYGTPWDFFRAVEKLVGERFDVDLAAHAENTKVPGNFVDVKRNSLSINWSNEFPHKLGWLNPEFADIEPWMLKCKAEKGLRIVTLTPASIGAKWFIANKLHEHALVLGFGPRLTFDGCKDPYPKDCMLMLWNFTDNDDKPLVGFDTWWWDR